MTAIFVAGAGTDIGKTFVAAGLIRELRHQGRAAAALKPVITGFEMGALTASDTGILLTALGRDVTPENAEALSPWRFRAPLSPDMAARKEGRTVDFDELVSLCRTAAESREDLLLIESAGGVMSPLDESHTMLDWAVALDFPTLLVAGSYLGALSHSLTALDALNRRGLKILAVIVSETPGSTVDLTDSIASLQRFAGPIPCIGLPRLPGAVQDHPAFKRLAGLL
jgi:dethiobiotin synthetase